MPDRITYSTDGTATLPAEQLDDLLIRVLTTEAAVSRVRALLHRPIVTAAMLQRALDGEP